MSFLPTWLHLQSEAKQATQIAELEEERGSLVSTVAHREEELSALREQLESTQVKLAGAQASGGHPFGPNNYRLIPTGLGMHMGASKKMPSFHRRNS
jgi:ribosomal protein L9